MCSTWRGKYSIRGPCECQAPTGRLGGRAAAWYNRRACPWRLLGRVVLCDAARINTGAVGDRSRRPKGAYLDGSRKRTDLSLDTYAGGVDRAPPRRFCAPIVTAIGQRFGLITLVECVMHHAKTGRLITLFASACLLLVFGCGLLGLALQQGAVTAPDIKVQLGPVIITTLGPRSFTCPPQNGPSMNVCDGLSVVPRLVAYRIWILWSTPGRGTESLHTLVQWTIPVRQ